MIAGFRHKGLQRFFETGSTAGIQVRHAERLELILMRLKHAREIQDLAFPGSGLHPLKRNRKGYWALKISGNWRIIFRMEGMDVYDVELIDYH